MADGDEEGLTEEEAEANAERIVGCVNGCQGIEDPAKTIPELVAIVKELYSHRSRGFGNDATGMNLVELGRVVHRLDVLQNRHNVP